MTKLTYLQERGDRFDRKVMQAWKTGFTNALVFMMHLPETIKKAVGHEDEILLDFDQNLRMIYDGAEEISEWSDAFLVDYNSWDKFADEDEDSKRVFRQNVLEPMNTLFVETEMFIRIVERSKLDKLGDASKWNALVKEANTLSKQAGVVLDATEDAASCLSYYFSK